MKFLANENMPLEVIKQLKEKGYDVMRVDDVQKGMNDNSVLKLSIQENRILITFDKDFGEKVFRNGEAAKGILLLRFVPESVDFITRRMISFLEKSQELENKFIVLEKDRVRIRDIK